MGIAWGMRREPCDGRDDVPEIVWTLRRHVGGALGRVFEQADDADGAVDPRGGTRERI